MTETPLQRALQCLFDQGRDPMFITDLQGNITHANPAFYRLYGYTPEELLGKDNSKLWQNAMHDEAYYQRFLDKLKQDGIWSGELHVTAKHGEILPVWTQIVRVDDAFAVTQVDLRERDKITRKMEQFSRLQSVATLAGGVAHEFNNILGGIQGHLYLFKRQIPETATKERERFTRIEGLMARATSLVQNLLAFSKQKEASVSEVNLNLLLEGVVAMYRKSMDKNIRLTLNLPEENCVVQGDATVLKQHVFELLSNAESAILRKRESGGYEEVSEHIDMQLRCDGQMARILIQDNGSGMQDAVLRHCLDPFFTTEPVGKGTGLGLSSVLSYVQQLHGTLEIESVYGEYTKVRLALPLYQQHQSADKGLVLLVDDDEDLRDSVEEILQYNGYRVLTAKDGLEGLDCWQMRRGEIDAVVMDIVMPNMNGIEAAKEIRKSDTQIPICLTTGYTQESVPEHLHVNLIRKPINPELLLEFLESCTQR